MINSQIINYKSHIKLKEFYFFAIYFLSILPFILLLVNNIFSLNYETVFMLSPMHFLFYAYIFGFPHILSSFSIYLNKKNINFYSRRLIAGVIFCSLTIIISYMLGGKNLTILVFVIWTISHVIKQQLNIPNIFGNRNDKVDEVIKYLLVGCLSFGYLKITNIIPNFILIENKKMYIAVIIFTLALVFLSLIKTIYVTKNLHYIIYILLLLISTVSMFLGYYFISIITLRIVHDLSSFYVYLIHNINFINEKYGSQKKIYLATFLTIIAPMLLNILIIYILSFNIYLFAYFYLLVQMLHYYMESYVWKGKSVVRIYTPV